MSSSTKDPEELAWWVALHSAQHVGPARFHRLVRRFGSPRNVLTNTTTDALMAIAGADASLLDAIVFAGVRIDYTRKLVERLLERGVKIVTFDAPAYPEPLRKLKWPPGLLYVQGEFAPGDVRGIGIIGSTQASARGFRAAYRSAGILASRGWTVVSGNARGIDTAAHLGAIEAGGRTVFVLADGILHFRPQVQMAPGKIERHAVVLSERPPEAPWEREGALARNRITAALCEKVFVVEARADSGALHTFRLAKQMGIGTLAAAYRTDTPDGNLMAIRQGAVEVRSVAQLLQAVATEGEARTETQQSFGWE